MNELWRELKRLDMLESFKWSAIDRWHLHDGWVDAVIDRMKEQLSKFEEKKRSKFVFVFSAHSVPMKVVEKGDHYVAEVAASVHKIMQKYGEMVENGEIEGVKEPNKFVLAWQSKVGFLPWMVPNTGSVIESLGQRGTSNLLVIPVAFTSDHIETLFEIGIEYAEDAEKAGIKNFAYTEGLNGSMIFVNALADIVKTHLDQGKNCSAQYKIKCLGCTKPMCRQLVNPAF